MSIELNCPSCGHGLRVSEELIGKKLRCKKCQKVFTAEDPNCAFEEVTDVEVVEDADVPVARQANRGPRVRRPVSDEGSRGAGPRSGARAAVQAPAIAMMCLGGLGLVLYLLSLLMMFQGSNIESDIAAKNPGAYKFGLVLGLVFGLIWPIIVGYGGIKMKALENYSSVWVAVVFMLLPCNLGCVLGIPLGIWAMVVLSQDHVRRALKLKALQKLLPRADLRRFNIRHDRANYTVRVQTRLYNMLGEIDLSRITIAMRWPGGWFS